MADPAGDERLIQALRELGELAIRQEERAEERHAETLAALRSLRKETARAADRAGGWCWFGLALALLVLVLVALAQLPRH